MTGGKSTPKIIQLIRQAQGLDPEEESILKKLTPHVPGVVTFADHNKPLPWTTEYRSVLVFADISGFTALCECYASMEKSGIDQLTKNLNDYLGAMVDLILKADGDVLKFAGDAILSLWRVNTPKDLLSVVEKVIRCCLNIQKNCGEWKTDIGVILTVKLGVSMGNTRVTFLGNDTFRMYVERGQPVTDVNIAESFCKSGYIVLSPYTWEICRKPRFTFEVLEDGQHVRVLSMKEDVQPVMPTIEITADEEENDDETANTPTNYLTRFKARRLSLESSANVKIMAKRFHSMAKRTSSAVQPSPSYESDVGTTTANPSVMSVNPTSSLMVNTFTSSPSVDSATTPESTESRLTPALDTSTLSVPVPPTLTPVDVTDSKAHISKPTSPSSPVKKGLAGGKLAKLRNVAKQVAKLKLDQSLRLYVLSPVLKKLDDNQPLEYLSEMRKVSIVFMNLILNKDFDATSLLQQVFDTVYLQSSIMHGCLNKVFLFDKGCTFLVIFGLPGYKHERDCAHALMCSYKMRKTLVKMAGVTNVSIGVTTGTTFCGVVGHTNRHEYSVIGSKVNMAARLMMHYPDKVTCDDNTFQFSRLQANSFQVLITKRMKGLRSSGVIREYTETDAESATNLNSVIRFQYPLLGRNYEKNIFDRELCFLLEGEDNGSYKECQHLVFVGAAGIGKTRLLDHLIVMTEKTGTRVISCSLKLDNLFDANFLTTYVILILLNSAGFSYQVNKEPILMDHLNRAGYASSLHKLNDILSCNFQKTDSAEGIQAKEEDLLCCIASVCIEKLGGVVIALDDAHHIDPKSWLFILRLITVPGVIVVSTVRPLAVEAPPCPAASNFFDHKMVKLRDIAGLESKYMTALACQLMEVSRIPKELERMLREMTHGVPSWCEQLLVDMVEKKQLTILQDSGHFKHLESMVAPPTRYIRRFDTDDDTSNLDVRQCNEIFYKTSSINTLKSESGHSILADLGFLTGNTSFNHDDEKEEKKSKVKRITVFSPGIEPNEIKVPDSMKELIMTRIDSMRASEQLIVKCAAVLGTSFSRDMLETILPKVQRVKARKCFRQLAFNGIFECANIPAARYNQMMQGRDDTISWDTCYCVKEENLYVQDLCNKMRFRNALIQQTAYETLMESQRRELHAKSAEYLEKQADKYRLKIPYYLLGRIPRNSETENTGSEIAVRRAGWKIRASIRVGDIGSYQQSRGRRFGFSLDIEKRDPLVQVLREQFSLNQTTDEMLECLLPTYKMILYHWKAAKRYQNLVNQILEASSAAVAISKAEQAMDLLVEVDAVLQSMENKDDVDCESLIILKSRANRLWSKTFKLVGQEEQCYSFLEKAARLVGLKQPTRIATAKLKLKVLKLGMFFAQNRDRPMLPASELVTEQCYCLLDLYYYHKENDNTQFMVLSAMLLMSKSCNRMPLLHHVVQGYYAVMEYYRSLSDRNMEMRLGLELIDRCLNRHKDLTKNDCVLLSRVYANLCILHLEAGNITQALTMGFSSINLAEKTSDDSFMKKTGHNLGFALILANKIDMCIDLLLKLRGGIPDRITSSWYYALCLELVQNGDPGPEHYISCLTFSASLFKSMDAVSGEHTSRYYLAMCMAIYYCRCQDWEACQRWFDYWELYRTTELSFFPLYTLCKEVEVKLLSISACRGKPHKVWKPMQASVRKDLDFLTRNLAILPGLKPRVFHLKSYYYALFCKTGKALRSLNRASKVAREQGNQSERRWTEHHRHVWFNAPKESRQWAKIPEENSNVWRWKPERGKLFTWPLG